MEDWLLKKSKDANCKQEVVEIVVEGRCVGGFNVRMKNVGFDL